MGEIIVPPYPLLTPRILDACDHRCVVEFVRKNHTAGEYLAKRRERRLIRDIARGKKQRRILAVKVGKLCLKIDVIMRVATDIARAARTRANVVQRLFHRRDYLGMLAHRQIIV